MVGTTIPLYLCSFRIAERKYCLSQLPVSELLLVVLFVPSSNCCSGRCYIWEITWFKHSNQHRSRNCWRLLKQLKRAWRPFVVFQFHLAKKGNSCTKLKLLWLSLLQIGLSRHNVKPCSTGTLAIEQLSYPRRRQPAVRGMITLHSQLQTVEEG